MRRKDEPPTRLSEDRAAEPAELPAQPAAHGLLALQRTAGNRAVGALLARDATTAEPADAKTPAPTAAPLRITVPGIGTIALDSWQFGVSTRRPPRRDGEPAPDTDKDGDLPGGEITVTSGQGPHSANLMRWSLDGGEKTVEIVMSAEGRGTTRLVLKGALVSSYQLSGGGENARESWTLNFTAMKQTFDEAKK